MSCEYNEIFKRYKGQPIEVITESGMKYCGILIDDDEDAIDIIDGKGRTVRIEKRKIEAVIEPRMKLNRLCADNDCCCKDGDYYEENCCY